MVADTHPVVLLAVNSLLCRAAKAFWIGLPKSGPGAERTSSDVLRRAAARIWLGRRMLSLSWLTSLGAAPDSTAGSMSGSRPPCVEAEHRVSRCCAMVGKGRAQDPCIPAAAAESPHAIYQCQRDKVLTGTCPSCDLPNKVGSRPPPEQRKVLRTIEFYLDQRGSKVFEPDPSGSDNRPAFFP